MKVIFKFMPILTGNWLYDNKPKDDKRTNNCVPFPCFSCKYYHRGSLLEDKNYIIDINYTLQEYDDHCFAVSNASKEFNTIEYDEYGKAICDKYARDLSISREL